MNKEEHELLLMIVQILFIFGVMVLLIVRPWYKKRKQKKCSHRFDLLLTERRALQITRTKVCSRCGYKMKSVVKL